MAFCPDIYMIQGKSSKYVKKSKPICDPAFMDQEISNFVYSRYLNGYAVEDIIYQMILDEKFREGGQWEGAFFNEDEVNEIIDRMNLVKMI
jgi:hypothetical protein